MRYSVFLSDHNDRWPRWTKRCRFGFAACSHDVLPEHLLACVFVRLADCFRCAAARCPQTERIGVWVWLVAGICAVTGIVLISLHVAGTVEDADAAAVAISDLPATVVAAVGQAKPGATITSAEVEEEDGEQLYEVTVVDGGVEYEIDVSPTGTVGNIDEEDDSGDWAEGTFVLVVGAVLLVVGFAAFVHACLKVRRMGSSKLDAERIP